MPLPPPPDAAYADRARASFAAQGVMRHLGAELTVVEPGRCVIELPFRPELTQQDGFFHAGVSATIVDTACGSPPSPLCRRAPACSPSSSR